MAYACAICMHVDMHNRLHTTARAQCMMRLTGRVCTHDAHTCLRGDARMRALCPDASHAAHSRAPEAAGRPYMPTAPRAPWATGLYLLSYLQMYVEMRPSAKAGTSCRSPLVRRLGRWSACPRCP